MTKLGVLVSEAIRRIYAREDQALQRAIVVVVQEVFDGDLGDLDAAVIRDQQARAAAGREAE